MSRPVPPRASLRDDVAILAAGIIPSVAVLELEGAQKRAKVREQIKARIGVQSEDDVRWLLDELLALPCPASPSLRLTCCSRCFRCIRRWTRWTRCSTASSRARTAGSSLRG